MSTDKRDKKKTNVEVRKGVLDNGLTGTISGMIVTKKGVIYMKK